MLEVQGTDLVAIDRPAASVARLAINRPDRRNALNPPLREKLAEAVTQLMADPSVRAIVLTGAGGHFCAGGDLDSLSALPKEEVGNLLARGHRLLRAIIDGGKPVVAAVEGAAAGGGAGLALAADLVVMGRSARFVLPFFRIGLVPDYGVVHALVRRAGVAAARRLVLSPAPITADIAQAHGIADAVVDDVQQTAIAWAQDLARQPARALAWTKRMVNAQPSSLEDSLRLEIEAQSDCFGSDEFRAGVAAFRRGA